MRPAPFHRLGAVSAVLLATGSAALAHPGHGASGLHSHPTDAWGFVVLAVCIAAAFAFGRRK